MQETAAASFPMRVIGSVIAPALKRTLFRTPYIVLLRYLLCYEETFEIGAVLGYAYRKRIVPFAQLLCIPGNEAELVPAIQHLAQKRLESQPTAPKTFIDMAMTFEDNRIRNNWRESGITEAQVAALAYRERIPIDLAVKNLTVALNVGVGLGSAFPELTERLWENEQEYVRSPERRAAAIASGVIGRNEPMIQYVSLAQ